MVSLTQIMRILSFPFSLFIESQFCIDLDFIDIMVTEWNVNIIHHNVKVKTWAGRQKWREAGQRTDRDAGKAQEHLWTRSGVSPG